MLLHHVTIKKQGLVWILVQESYYKIPVFLSLCLNKKTDVTQIERHPVKSSFIFNDLLIQFQQILHVLLQ